jgi:hypothetical protein
MFSEFSCLVMVKAAIFTAARGVEPLPSSRAANLFSRSQLTRSSLFFPCTSHFTDSCLSNAGIASDGRPLDRSARINR